MGLGGTGLFGSGPGNAGKQARVGWESGGIGISQYIRMSQIDQTDSKNSGCVKGKIGISKRIHKKIRRVGVEW